MAERLRVVVAAARLSIAHVWRSWHSAVCRGLTRRQCLLLVGAVVVGLGVRVPGVFWGSNFPTGWTPNHIDEASHWVLAEPLIVPHRIPRWEHPYPRGTAAHVAVPIVALRAVQGRLRGNPPPDRMTITLAGRAISVLYGAATIVVLFLFSRLLFRDPRVAVLAAWILALGGLHVTQSHFFLADVPALFWFLLGSCLLFQHLTRPAEGVPPYLLWGSFSLGVAFGIKLVMIGLPTLAIVSLVRRPRIRNAIYAFIFFLAGFVIVNLASYTANDLYQSLSAVRDPWEWSVWANIWLYAIELPSLMSLPMVLLALGGLVALAYRGFVDRGLSHRSVILLIVVLPMALQTLLVVFTLDHFLRHLIPFIPWFAVAAAWSLTRIADALSRRRIPAATVYAPLFIYLALFVFDGERVFIQEPRNKAAAWILENVPKGTAISWRKSGDFPGYPKVYFPTQGRPPIVVIDMHLANFYLSGMNFRDSYPRDARRIFDAMSQERVDKLQALFKGETEYREVARFGEGYFMPEYVLVDRLIGNRSRNYVAEVVIFQRDADRQGERTAENG